MKAHKSSETQPTLLMTHIALLWSGRVEYIRYSIDIPPRWGGRHAVVKKIDALDKKLSQNFNGPLGKF
ncbi:hypothetical protein F4X33_09060 [Candidatus Poribacteria bacterium]|nr:hypothetical protein [Candidatus Poribacteria bacterium]